MRFLRHIYLPSAIHGTSQVNCLLSSQLLMAEPLLQSYPVSLTWARCFSLQICAVMRLLICTSLSPVLYRFFFNRDLPHYTAGKAVAMLHFHEVSLDSSGWPPACYAPLWPMYDTITGMCHQRQSKSLPDNKYSVDICLLSKWKLSKYSTHFHPKNWTWGY